MRTLKLALAFLVGLNLGAAGWAEQDQGCFLLPVKMGIQNPGNPKVFQPPHGDFEILFHEPALHNAMTVDSEGFEIINRKTKRSCTGSAPTDADVTISANERLVAAVSYDSDVRTLEFIDPETCKTRRKVVWHEAAVRFKENRVSIDANCQCHSEVSCLCEPAQIFDLKGPHCEPMLQTAESNALTKTQLNVDIDRPSYVLHPKLPDAQVVKARD